MIAPSTPISGLGLSVRTTAALRLAGVATFGQLADLTAETLQGLPNVTPACVEELRGLVADRAPRSAVRFLGRDDLVARLKRAALWQAGECQRLGDEWARTMAELELTATYLAGLGVEP